MEHSNETPLILTVFFQCLHAPNFQTDIELKDCNRVQGLQEAWDIAIKHFCPNETNKLRRQLKRKLGLAYNFNDQQNVVLRFMNPNGKRDEIRVVTNYTEI